MNLIGSFGNSFSYGRGNCNCGCGCNGANNQPDNKTGKGGGSEGMTGQEPDIIKDKADNFIYSRTMFSGAEGQGGSGRSSIDFGKPF